MYLTGDTCPACTEAHGSVVLHIHQQPRFVPCLYIHASSSVLDRPFGLYCLVSWLLAFKSEVQNKIKFKKIKKNPTNHNQPPPTPPKKRARINKPGSAPVSFQALFRPHASYTSFQRNVIFWQSHVLCYPFSVLRESCWAYVLFENNSNKKRL